MKRLSDITSDIVNDLYENSDWYGDYSLIEAAINRLAAYEDTGLEPEGVVHLAECWQQEHETLCQYLALGSIDRLRELAQADREKRIIVIPKDNNELLEKLKDLFFSDWAALEGMKNG